MEITIRIFKITFKKIMDNLSMNQN